MALYVVVVVLRKIIIQMVVRFVLIDATSVNEGRMKKMPALHSKGCKHCGRKGDGYYLEPDSYGAWHDWAERMDSNGYYQQPCPDCGRFTIWHKKADSPTLVAKDDGTPIGVAVSWNPHGLGEMIVQFFDGSADSCLVSELHFVNGEEKAREYCNSKEQ
jgi:hypothetical protein